MTEVEILKMSRKLKGIFNHRDYDIAHLDEIKNILKLEVKSIDSKIGSGKYLL